MKDLLNYLPIIVLAVITMIFILKAARLRKEKEILENRNKFSNTSNRNLTLEVSKLRKDMIFYKEQSDKPKVSKIPLILQPVSNDVLKGDISFRRVDNNKLIEAGTISVTVHKGRIQKVYTSTRKNRNYVKVPIVIITKK